MTGDFPETVSAIRRKARQIFGADDPVNPGAPTLETALIVAWMDEVRAYWASVYEAASPSGRAEYDLAKTLCIRAVGEGGANAITMAYAGMSPCYAPTPPRLGSMHDSRVIVIQNMLSRAVPLWVHYVGLARDALDATKPA